MDLQKCMSLEREGLDLSATLEQTLTEGHFLVAQLEALEAYEKACEDRVESLLQCIMEIRRRGVVDSAVTLKLIEHDQHTGVCRKDLCTKLFESQLAQLARTNSQNAKRCTMIQQVNRQLRELIQGMEVEMLDTERSHRPSAITSRLPDATSPRSFVARNTRPVDVLPVLRERSASWEPVGEAPREWHDADSNGVSPSLTECSATDEALRTAETGQFTACDVHLASVPSDCAEDHRGHVEPQALVQSDHDVTAVPSMSLLGLSVPISLQEKAEVMDMHGNGDAHTESTRSSQEWSKELSEVLDEGASRNERDSEVSDLSEAAPDECDVDLFSGEEWLDPELGDPEHGDAQGQVVETMFARRSLVSRHPGELLRRSMGDTYRCDPILSNTDVDSTHAKKAVETTVSATLALHEMCTASGVFVEPCSSCGASQCAAESSLLARASEELHVAKSQFEVAWARVSVMCVGSTHSEEMISSL